jgi:hypothetical protein
LFEGAFSPVSLPTEGETSMLQNIRKNWKTSLDGAALISVGVLGVCGIVIPGVNVDLGVALMVGVPLLLASDAKISG